MVRLATQYVKISGIGRFNKRGGWTTVTVDSIHSTRPWDKPLHLGSLMGNQRVERSTSSQ